jgi:folate-dependent phosphoribosylglycinamide formyltransferase PurN
VTDPLVRQQLLNLPPLLPAVNNAAPQVNLVPNKMECEHNGTVFVVRDMTDDGNEVVCEVVEVAEDDDNNLLSVEDIVNLPLNVVNQAVTDYNRMESRRSARVIVE